MSFTLISTVTVTGSPAATIDIASIPATFTDLYVVASLRENGSATQRSSVIRFNNDSGSNYVQRMLQGDGSSATSASATTTSILWAVHNDTNSTANTFSNCQLYIPNYAGATNKSVSLDSVGENNATFSLQRLTAALWNSTAAITRITFTGENSNFIVGSTVSVYGVTKGSGGASVSP